MVRTGSRHTSLGQLLAGIGFRRTTSSSGSRSPRLFLETRMISLKLLSLVVACSSIAVLPGELRAQPQPSSRPPQIKVTLPGTAPGPPVRVGWAGISTLVEAGGQRFLFDAGYGSLARARGVRPANGRGYEGLSHTPPLRSHCRSACVPASPVVCTSERDVPFEVSGPPERQR